MSKRMNGWMNERINKPTNEWVNPVWKSNTLDQFLECVEKLITRKMDCAEVIKTVTNSIGWILTFPRQIFWNFKHFGVKDDIFVLILEPIFIKIM